MARETATRRFERDALLACAILTAGAWLLSGGRVDVALGVVAGGGMMCVSYLAIKGGVTALAEGMSRTAAAADVAPPAGDEVGEPGEADRRRLPRGVAVAMVKFLVRYALLAVLAYVMLTRLRLHPVGVVVGVSAPVVAAAAELVRAARSTARPHHPR